RGIAWRAWQTPAPGGRGPALASRAARGRAAASAPGCAGSGGPRGARNSSTSLKFLAGAVFFTRRPTTAQPGRGLPPSRTNARVSQASCDAGADLPTGREQSRMAQTVVPGLERRLKAHLLGDEQFDASTRGRYATDASHYQIMPLGVVAPRSVKEAEYALALAREEGVSVLPRGAGTSQAGQTVNSSLVIDCSKYLDHLIELDVGGRRC